MDGKEIVCLIDERTSSKLDKKVFYVFLSIMVIIIAGIVGMLSNIIADQSKSYNEITNRLTRIETNQEYMQKDVANIKSILNSYEIIDEAKTQTKKGY